MSQVRLSRRLLCFAFCLSPLVSSLGQQLYQVRFRVVADTMIVVPVTINGVGPFDFLLDTGATESVIDQRLAAELNLPLAGNINLITHQGSAFTSVFRADSLLMAGATVRGLTLSAVNDHAYLVPKVRGVVGEDFLRKFDLLIDYKHRLLQFESASGPLADRLDGERLPLRNGLYHGELTHNRLVVMGHIGASRDKDVTLLLDSGAAIFLLLAKLNKFSSVSQQPLPSASGVVGDSFGVDAQSVLGLQLGKAFLPNLTVFTPTATIPGLDVDGLLPTSLFRSIFISHSGGFVILNPSAKPALTQSKSPSRPGTDISDVPSLRNESPVSQ